MEEYRHLIDKLASDFERTIPENDSEREKLIKSFRNYLELAIEAIENSNSKYIRKDPDTIKRILEKIAEDFFGMELSSKKQKLIPDKSYDKIQEISGDIFNFAKRKKSGEKLVIEFNSSSKINELKILLEKVAPYNKKRAKNLISEAILDLKYICQDEEKLSSLRLFRFINSKKYSDNEEER